MVCTLREFTLKFHQKSLLISNAVKIDSFLGKIELILSLYCITLFTRQFSQHE